MSVASKLKVWASQLSRASSSSKPINKNDALKLDARASEPKAAKTKLDAEQMELEDEKSQLRFAKTQQKVAQSHQLEVAISKIESAETQLEDARNEFEDSRAYLEAAKTQLEVVTNTVNTTSSLGTWLEEENNELRKQVTEQESSESKLKGEVMKYKTEISNLKGMSADGYYKSQQEDNKRPTESLTKERERERLGNPKVNFDMTFNGAPLGRIVFELYADTHPRLAEIFRELCVGEKILPGTDRFVGYKGTEIVYVGYGKLMCGGNVRVKNRAEFESIYGHISDREIAIRKATWNGDLFINIDYDEQLKNKTCSFMISGSNSYEYDEFVRLPVIGRVVEGIDVVDNPKDYGIPDDWLAAGTLVISDCGQLS